VAKRYVEYDPQVLEKLHQVQLEILQDVDQFCEEHDLKYFVHYGSMLGAIRHHGFIPWDDDIDIAMMRRDYERFVELARKDLRFCNKYEVLAQPDKKYPNVFAKVSKKGTRLISDEMLEMGISWGINIDVFPLDRVPENQKDFEKKAKKAFFLSKLMYLYYYKHPHVPGTGLVNKVLSFGCMVVHQLLVWCPLFKPERIQEIYRKNCETDLPSGNFVDYYCSFAPARLVFSCEDIFPTVRIPFEHTSVCIPKDYDRMLTTIYGDYMQLPPIEKRKNHAPEVIDFGDE